MKENLSARVVSEESIHVNIDENRDPTIEVALNRAIANFSNSKEGDFANYLKKDHSRKSDRLEWKSREDKPLKVSGLYDRETVGGRERKNSRRNPALCSRR